MKHALLTNWIGLLVVIASYGRVQAELPPDFYPNPKLASENIDIRVLSVSKRMTSNDEAVTNWDVEINAEVIAERKSGTQLVKGSRIVISYSAREFKLPPPPGPGSQPILSKGESYSAFLSVTGTDKNRTYHPGGAPYNTFGFLPNKKSSNRP